MIEWLKFTVDPNQRETFVQKDREIWTAALAQYRGFLGKEVWISPDQLDEVVFVIRWFSFEQWDAIPSNELQQVERAFATAMGETRYQLVHSARYQVRKFSPS